VGGFKICFAGNSKSDREREIKRDSIDGFSGGATAGALPNDRVMERDPFAEAGRIPVLAVPAQNDDFTLFGGAAGHSRREGAGLVGVASSLFDPAGPVARPEILPPVDDWALSVEPEEFLQLLADFARQARPHSAAVRQLQRAEVPL